MPGFFKNADFPKIEVLQCISLKGIPMKTSSIQTRHLFLDLGKASDKIHHDELYVRW